jgi:Zn/Cd-binding protein ZinT
MAKFYGKIGFVSTGSNEDGVWKDSSVEERTYSGDVIRNSIQWQSGDQVNDDLKINNTISIVADSFANKNLQTMKYIVWMGASWKITNIEVQRPRLILTIGGVYNGD